MYNLAYRKVALLNATIETFEDRMVRHLGDKPINRQAAIGMSYGPGERYPEEIKPPPGNNDFVLTLERQKELRRELAVKKEKRRIKNRARKLARKQNKLAEQMISKD